MKYLVDTVVFLRMIFGERDLIPSRALKALEAPSHNLYLSVASFMEISIKYSIGKLNLKKAPDDWLVDAALKWEMTILPIEAAPVLKMGGLPFHHKDPFDRLLVCQCVYENLTLISPDKIFRKYKVPLLWV